MRRISLIVHQIKSILTSSQGVLSIVGHGICLIQNDQLISRIEHGPGGGKVHDGSSDNANATIVRCIEFQHHRVELSRCVELFSAGEDCAGLAGSWRAIE